MRLNIARKWTFIAGRRAGDAAANADNPITLENADEAIFLK